jgi:orotate phosphoribosyltransferase
VISAGTSVRESMALIDAADASGAGVAIAVDRQERGTGERSAVQEVGQSLGLQVISIINLDALIAYLEEKPDRADDLDRISAYRERYGVA